MEQIIFKPSLYKYGTCKEFAEGFQLKETDLILTNEYIYEPSFGKLTLPEVLAPAIRYAREGYPVPVTTADLWQRTEQALRAAHGGPESCPPEFRGWYQVFAPSGHAPRAV